MNSIDLIAGIYSVNLDLTYQSVIYFYLELELEHLELELELEHVICFNLSLHSAVSISFMLLSIMYAIKEC